MGQIKRKTINNLQRKTVSDAFSLVVSRLLYPTVHKHHAKKVFIMFKQHVNRFNRCQIYDLARKFEMSSSFGIEELLNK